MKKLFGVLAIIGLLVFSSNTAIADMNSGKALEPGSVQTTRIVCKDETDILKVVHTHVKFGLRSAQSVFQEQVAAERCFYFGGPMMAEVQLIEIIYTNTVKGGYTVNVWKARGTDAPPGNFVYVVNFIKDTNV